MKYVKCSVLDRDRERGFSRIATRGVVKFFNVLHQQQTDIKAQVKSVGSFERKIDKVYNSINKGSFLDRLKETNESNDDNSNSFDHDNNNNNDAANKPTWSVLRDDFAMGAEIKDWENNTDLNEDENDGVDGGKNGNKINNNKKSKKKFKK